MIRRELGVFLIIGSLTVAVDFLTYHSLLWIGMNGIALAKAISFLVGTLFAYFANRSWTFNSQAHAAGSAMRFAMLYALTLAANVIVNTGALHLFAGTGSAMQMAFLLATGISACLNFIGMKLFVFKARSVVEQS